MDSNEFLGKLNDDFPAMTWGEMYDFIVISALYPPVRRKNINWRKLRDKFFDECTSPGTQTQLVKVNMVHNNLFEWFKGEIENESK